MIEPMSPGIRTGAPVTDIDEIELAVTPPQHHAAGIPAVAVALNRAIAQAGVVRTAQALSRLNHRGGFDCPGCAWPDPQGRRRPAEFCENGAKAVAEESTLRTVGPDFFAAHPVSELLQRSEFWLGGQGRLTEPMVIREGSDNYEPITWDGAFTLIAEHLRATTPDRAAFYTSGRTSNEAAYLYQLLARSYGTNNLPDCSNMCHESSGTALLRTIGIGKGSVSLADIHHADLILVVGQNPGTNHPRMLSALTEAKEHGAHIVAVNPLPEAGLFTFRDPQTVTGLVRGGIELADDFLQIKLGGDLALFQALGHLLIAAEDAAPGSVVDKAFVAASTEGYDAYAQARRTIDWAAIGAATGLPREQIEALGPADGHVQRHHRVLGHGTHPAQAFGADPAGGRQPAADPRHDRQARRRGVSGARPFQRAGRPDDGHLGADAGMVPVRVGRRARHHLAASTRVRHGRHAQRHGGGRHRRLHRVGRQLRGRHPRHRGHRGGAPPGRADRADLHQAEPVAPGARPGRPDPPDSRPVRSG